MAESKPSQANALQVGSGMSYIIKPKTMALDKEELKVLVESSVDFASLSRNGVDVVPYLMTQEIDEHFKILNGPSYKELVIDFWVRAEVYDEDATKGEEWEKIAENPSLKGKTRK